MAEPVILYLVMPCYNEEEVLRMSSGKALDLYARLIDNGTISSDSRILFSDDGSKDRTWEIITELHAENETFCGIRLSKNRGHQIAIYSGMVYAAEHGAECVITIDADLQQDIEAVPRFLQKYAEGCDIVYGVRDSRDTDSLFKKTTATMYYKFMRSLGCDLIEQSADYRLLSNRAVKALASYKENNLFIRGLVPEMGFKSDIVYFHVKEREAGSSKYTLKKMVSLALNGITSFSIQPIRLVGLLGVGVLIVSVVMMIVTLIDHIRGVTVAGWSTIVISIWFLGSIQLISLGVIGEYVGRTYMETKNRPRYFISDETGDGK
ncbi:MAG: glycosyltransferase family 2 protein [Lachnospiraceae bacterium]|nr:glycosyltransferase family 2 protein [Lachnospiraceae bacterium]MBR1913658.1 glycosyltransferase family 2 protein [Lachnospiraceae bacterium]